MRLRQWSAALALAAGLTGLALPGPALPGPALPGPALAGTPVAIGIGARTGFAPLAYAARAGLFAKRGLDVTIRKQPQDARRDALASGDLQCAAATVDSWIVWNAGGVRARQILEIDKSFGADAVVARGAVKQLKDLKGKRVAVSAPGTSPYFLLAWVLDKVRLTPADVTPIVLEPEAATGAFLAGQGDAAVTYEPYLTKVRSQAGQAGQGQAGQGQAGQGQAGSHILVTTLDYPVVIDTLGCTRAFLDAHPETARALVEGYYDALDAIKADPVAANEAMGREVGQSGQAFADTAFYLRWADRAANASFFNGEIQSLSKRAADLMARIGLIKGRPTIDSLIDARFVR